MRFIRKSLWAGLFMTLAACSTFQPKTDVEQVEERSQARMDLLRAGEFEKAYEYMTPGYRQANSLERFRTDHAGIVRFKFAQVESAECEEDVCSVKLKVAYDFIASITAKPIPVERTNTERWIKVDDNWWCVRSN